MGVEKAAVRLEHPVAFEASSSRWPVEPVYSAVRLEHPVVFEASSSRWSVEPV